MFLMIDSHLNKFRRSKVLTSLHRISKKIKSLATAAVITLLNYLNDTPLEYYDDDNTSELPKSERTLIEKLNHFTYLNARFVAFKVEEPAWAKYH